MIRLALETTHNCRNNDIVASQTPVTFGFMRHPIGRRGLMNRDRNFSSLKAMIKVLLSSFIGAFIGAGWAAYLAVQLGKGHGWLPLSVVGAMAVCGLMLVLFRPSFGKRIFN